MSTKYYIIYLIFILPFLLGCEKSIEPGLDKAPDVIIVDAWINNKIEPQVVKLRRSIPYFEESALPGITEAKVRMIREDGEQFIFIESETQSGDYIWTPQSDSITMGVAGDRFVLDVKIGNLQIGSFSEMNRVPEIDSITFMLASDNPVLKGSILAEFWSTDFIGQGDTYWIKAYKNGAYLNKPSEINIAYDAGFSRGDGIDGVTFNKFIRTGVNPYEQDKNGNIISPYKAGDSLYVEIHSITLPAYSFLFEVSVQTNRPGGFAEIFAVPLANVGSNIVNVTNGEVVTGFFNVSAVSSFGKKYSEED
jgi:hypothetical protein